MTAVATTADADLLDILRADAPLGVSDMAKTLEVTPTAIRQRLGRLLAQGLVEREAIRYGRGRPMHRYQLSKKGLRLTGSNFTDLALAMWTQLSTIEDDTLRNRLVDQVVTALAENYSSQITGQTTAERMESLRELLAHRRLAFSVDQSSEIPVLTAHSCPYPDLAEVDSSICSLERRLFAKLLGDDVDLVQCRDPETGRCQFQPT